MFIDSLIFSVLLPVELCTERGGIFWEEQSTNYLTSWRTNQDSWDQRFRFSFLLVKLKWLILTVSWESKINGSLSQIPSCVHPGLWEIFGQERGFWLWLTLCCTATMTLINLHWYSFLTFPFLLCSRCQSNLPGTICVYGTVVFPRWGPVACQALWEYAKDKNTRGLHWQVGHR